MFETSNSIFPTLHPIFGVFGISIGVLIGYFFIGQRRFDEAARREKAEKALAEAKHTASSLVAEAKEAAHITKQRVIAEAVRTEEQMKKRDNMLLMKEELFKKRSERNNELKNTIDKENQTIAALKAQAQAIGEKMNTSLIERVGMTKETIKEKIINEETQLFAKDSQDRILRFEELMREDSVKMAKNFLSEAIYRFADPATVKAYSGEVTVPHDEIKGRVVGRGGKNVRAFEDAYGVDIVFNDEPNTISLSCFNLVNREVARQALLLLMNEKNITPELIVSIKEKAQQKVEVLLIREGEKTVKDLGLQNINPELIKLIGRLQFRTSYGQNALRHCIEVGCFARLLAASIGADEDIAFIGGFFHDIGKAIDQEAGGSHDALTKEILEKYNFPWEIVHAAWTHHDAIPQETVEAVIVKAADAISAGRPGARALSIEQYIQKIKELEGTAASFEGVKKAFAISAGREVRVIVNPEAVSDERSQQLAESIADTIEAKGGYPGKIKVTTIRTTKAVDYAK